MRRALPTSTSTASLPTPRTPGSISRPSPTSPPGRSASRRCPASGATRTCCRRRPRRRPDRRPARTRNGRPLAARSRFKDAVEQTSGPRLLEQLAGAVAGVVELALGLVEGLARLRVVADRLVQPRRILGAHVAEGGAALKRVAVLGRSRRGEEREEEKGEGKAHGVPWSTASAASRESLGVKG